MNYPSIRIEGAILSPDILERLDDAPGQQSADFGFDRNAKVKDEIARAWADAQDYWRIFQRKLETLRPDSAATTETRQQWVVPLLGLLGYQLEYQSRGVELNGKTYAISHRVANRGQTPVHITGFREPSGLDRKPEKAVLRMSAHAMVQEYLTLAEELYGLVTNGRLLRLLRDSSRLVKLTYLEFDLDRIFTDGLFADFAVLYRLLHATRLPASQDAAAESLIERYHQDSLDSGSRIRDGLSRAVEQAIRDFANGFLAHPANETLRNAAASGELKPDLYYQHLLRLIYRLLFLMVIEERGLVFPPKTPPVKRDIYERYYSVQRLRRLSEKRYLADRRHHDLWLALQATFHLFEAGGAGTKIGLAPLAGDLFSSDAIGLLARATLGNDVLLACLRSLGLYRHPDTRQVIRVNYAALNVEELGSVYEGLLKFNAVFSFDAGAPAFDLQPGADDTQSHYTDDDLVQPLIKHSLNYLIADKLKERDPEQALLSLRVADISCGSGHILLAAARRIATQLAIVRTGEEQPSPSAFRTAIRDVIRECIYGVDLNPLAVELCKVALWLEAHNPGEPLNFLDHHIKCGNAIVGFSRREEVERGVPDEAFVTMHGDDKETAALVRKRNKAERKEHESGQIPLAPAIQKQLDDILHGWRELSILPERTPEDIAAKKRRYQDFTKSEDAWLLNQIAAIPIAQFYLAKTPANMSKLITDAEFRRYWKGERSPQGQATAEAWALGERMHFFHWFLEFPEIIQRGGFDCILGNPPYKGGTHLSGTFGHEFCSYVKWQFAPAGLSDLVVYFVRRIFDLLRPNGFMAFLTTNSIRDGDIREDGLEQLRRLGATINFAVRGVKWPGRAKLVVSLLSIQKGQWSGTPLLDGKPVAYISPYLEAEQDLGEPVELRSNVRMMFEGSKFLGDGFVLTHTEAKSYVERSPSESKVIFSLINGDEVNNEPDQAPRRSIINFADWPEEKATEFPLSYERVLRLVKPIREKDNRAVRRERWWQHAERAVGLYQGIAGKGRCFMVARTTKHLSFSAAPTNYVFTEALKVFTTDRWDLYAIVQSTLHEVWARKYSGALETRLRYSPSDCFENFPFPEGLWQTANPTLAEIGERYHEHRRALMRQLWLGLTDIYNLFHARALTPVVVAKVSKKSAAEVEAGYQGILELRRLHRELDEAIRDAYGWQPLDLGHDFHEVETLPENDRVRYTISPTARKEVLRRLLALNHERVAAQTMAAPVKKARRAKGAAEQVIEDMFATGTRTPLPSFNPALLPDGVWARHSTDHTAEMGVILAAILKVAGSPEPARNIRLASILIDEPRLLIPALTAEEALDWRRLVGTEAAPMAAEVRPLVPGADRAWGRAVQQLRGNGLLAEDLSTNTWGPGPGLDAIPTAGWPDGRAAMVLSVLRWSNTDEVIRQLPDEIQRWIYAQAA
ncbi:MAG: restriction endonuclease [Burkholderiales bacterium]|nr:restriction endonuclease [Burkholderiales bacterium]